MTNRNNEQDDEDDDEVDEDGERPRANIYIDITGSSFIVFFFPFYLFRMVSHL